MAPIRPEQFGRLHVEREGRDAVVVAVGPLLETTLEAVADLDVTVLYATTVTPFDGDTLRAVMARPSGRTRRTRLHRSD